MPVHPSRRDPDQKEIAIHLAATFAQRQPEDAVDLLSTTAAMLHWGAQQPKPHGYAFFSVGMETPTDLPITCAGVFPAELLEGHSDIQPEVFDAIIAALNKAKAKAVERRAAKQASGGN